MRVPEELLVHLRRAPDFAERHYAEPLEPSDRPYGVEAVMRDNSGNWLVLIEPEEYTGADFPHP